MFKKRECRNRVWKEIIPSAATAKTMATAAGAARKMAELAGKGRKKVRSEMGL